MGTMTEGLAKKLLGLVEKAGGLALGEGSALVKEYVRWIGVVQGIGGGVMLVLAILMGYPAVKLLYESFASKLVGPLVVGAALATGAVLSGKLAGSMLAVALQAIIAPRVLIVTTAKSVLSKKD